MLGIELNHCIIIKVALSKNTFYVNVFLLVN